MPLTSTSPISITNTAFADASEIDSFFIEHGGQDFISWFNTHVGGKQFWGKVGSRAALMIANDSLAHERFNQLWSAESIHAIFDNGQITLLQFLALQSIVTNETGGRMIPLTEGVGRIGHPGIAYAFDKIPGIKKSYNTLPGNKTCLQCFNDPNYNRAFANLPLANNLRNTTNPVWASETYPQQLAPTSTNPGLSGYILEADFFKFRGRGFIQTTGRANYIQLINFIMSYNGVDELILSTKARWSNISNDADVLASISSNANWDDLFQKSENLIPCRAIRTHNRSGGNYLEKLHMQDLKTVFNMGLRISGATSYATLFQNRVQQILALL
jgi:hypothetical protein